MLPYIYVYAVLKKKQHMLTNTSGWQLMMFCHKWVKSNLNSHVSNSPHAFTPLMFSVRQTVSWSCGTSTNLTVCAPSRVTSMRRTLLAWPPMETMLPVVRNDCIKVYSDNVASESVTQHSFDICSAKQGLFFHSSREAVMTAPCSLELYT